MTTAIKYLRSKAKLLFVCLLTASLFGACLDSPTAPKLVKPNDGVAGDGNFNKIIEYIVQKNNIPAMATVLIKGNEILDIGVAGKRDISESQKVTMDDKWHIGSITKSMTATLAAIFVEKGEINWETTITDVFPEFIGKIDTSYYNVRLIELLSHSAGIMSDVKEVNNYVGYYYSTDPLNDQRYDIIQKILNFSPEVPKGTFLYSNGGYIIAGAMLEKRTGKQYEDLLREYLFKPLKMTSSGFGPPATSGATDQPLGHFEDGASYDPIDPSEINSDNLKVMAPAATVHLPLNDMAAYMMAHLGGEKGADGVISADSFKKLHNGIVETDFPGIKYGMGWNVSETALIHSGSNGSWIAQLVIVPADDIAFFIVTNSVGESTDQAHEDMINSLQKRFIALAGS